MLLTLPRSSYNFSVDNWGSGPSTSPGASLTAGGTNNTKGSWTQISGGALARACNVLVLDVYNSFASAAIRDQLMDIGVDPAGGSSYTTVIPNISVGQGSNPPPGHQYKFYIYIPSGASVAVRTQCNSAGATAKIIARFLGSPTHPEGAVPDCTVFENLGANTSNSQGAGFTPGSSSAWGSWTLIGTTTRSLWWWQLGMGCSNTIVNAEQMYTELAFGDGTTFTTIRKDFWAMLSNEVVQSYTRTNLSDHDCIRHVPAGSGIYLRGMDSAATPTTGFHATVIGGA